MNSLKLALELEKLCDLANDNISLLHASNPFIKVKPKKIQKYSELKKSILNRDDYQCRICCADATEAQMHIHHIDADRSRNEGANLITLCRSCHEHIHREGFVKGRMNWDEDHLPWDDRPMAI